MCPHIEETSKISLNSNEIAKFKIKEVMDCESRNLIYCIVCRGCGEKYIGQTGDILRMILCTLLVIQAFMMLLGYLNN